MNRNKKIIKRAGMALLSGMIALTPAAAVAAPLVAPIVAQAASQTDADWYSDWTYTTDGTTIKLTKYSGSETTYTVPATATIDGTTYSVQYGAGGSVVSVGKITSLSFAKGVKFPDNCSKLFYNQSTLTSIDFVNADTSNVTNMEAMFEGCSGLTTLDLSSFNTSKVTSIHWMFQDCTKLTDINVSSFDTSAVAGTGMRSVFNNCSALKNIDISKWNTKNVTSLNYLFYNCKSLTTLSLSSFDTSNVNEMESTFQNCNSLTSLDLSNFDTSNVAIMSGTFQGCNSLTSVNLSGWNTSKLTTIHNMFNGCSKLAELDLGSFDMSNVTDGGNFLQGTTALTKIVAPKKIGTSDINFSGKNFYTVNSDGTVNLDDIYTRLQKVPSGSTIVTAENNVTDSSIAWLADWDFNSNTSAKTVTLSKYKGTQTTYKIPATARLNGMTYTVQVGTSSAWDTNALNTGKITDLSFADGIKLLSNCSSLFDGQTNLKNIDLSNVDASSVTGVKSMFKGCSSLTSLDLSALSSANATDMMDTFNGCNNLTSINLSGFNTSKVTRMLRTFYGCSKLTELDLSSFDMSKVENTNAMFYGMNSLNKIVAPKVMSASQTTTLPDIFYVEGSSDSATPYRHLEKVPAGSTLTTTYTGTISDESANWYADWTYSIDDTNKIIAISKYNGTQTDYVIPSSAAVDGDASYTVKLDGYISTGTIKNLKVRQGIALSGNLFGSSILYDMFSGNRNIVNLDLSGVIDSSKTGFVYMFENCPNLESVNFNDCDFSNARSDEYGFTGWFSGCSKLVKIGTPKVLPTTSAGLPGTFYAQSPIDGKADTNSTPITDLKDAPANTYIVTTAYEGDPVPTVTFDKYLAMKTDASVPNVAFDFTIEPGDAVPSDVANHTMGIYAGIGTPSIVGMDGKSAAVFTPADTTTAESDATADQNVKFSTTDNKADEKFATKTMIVNFGGIAFPEPGIYRYKITETENSTASIASDPAAVRYLDVYVNSDDKGVKSVAGFVLHNEATTVTMDGTTSGSTGAYTDVKSQGYTNTFTSYDLTISNKVTGNQSSQDKYFKYTVVLTNLGKDNVVNIDLTNAEAFPSATASTAYDSISNTSSITADENGAATATFYLKNGQSIKLMGLAKSAGYTVTEAEEDYSPAKTVTGTTDTATDVNAVTEAAIDSDDTVTFTNTRQGAVPTGVILSMMPYLVGSAAAIGGVTITAAVKRKKNGDEE